MSWTMPQVDQVTVALCLLVTAAVLGVWAILAPGSRLGRDRRLHGIEQQQSTLTRATDATTAAIDAFIKQRSDSPKAANALDRAGIRMRVADYVLMSIAVTLATLALGAVLANVFVGVIMGGVAAAGCYFNVMIKADRRKAAFADQLDDMLQLLASSLRAGHSLLQSLDSVAQELDEPASNEIARIVNQVRVGRDLGLAMDEVAERMDSDDFRWVAQAVAIHRTVGGNLAEVLDTVAETIRDRGQIRRQVKALAAEGKLSAVILVALPVCMAGFLSWANPAYMSRLVDNMLGLIMITVAVLLLIVGSLWLRKMVTIKF
ncbi:type II secretion system F family protein [Ornithinicoccus halotolerans]|uniref:type II secretion system F family protein n=1 Tax=Ornithinicoccus halotolerans TaxID=1748220 RepID=UPI001E5CD2C7|nr:type II secretion system F family protein [Ornithinicoccus halotolerans]